MSIIKLYLRFPALTKSARIGKIRLIKAMEVQLVIALGKWGCDVNNMFFKGRVEMTVSDNNGQYGFELVIPGMDIPDYQVKSVTESGNTLSAVVFIPMLGKDVEVTATFTEDSFNGEVKLPIFGKIKLQEGFRIA